MFLNLRFMLDHHSFVVLAVHPAHGVGNFADRGIGFDGLDDHRHQVACTARGIFDGLQRGLPFRRITPGAQHPQALDLLLRRDPPDVADDDLAVGGEVLPELPGRRREAVRPGPRIEPGT